MPSNQPSEKPAETGKSTPTEDGNALSRLARTILGPARPDYKVVLPNVANAIGGTFHDAGNLCDSHISYNYRDAKISLQTGTTAAGRAIISRTSVTLEFPEMPTDFRFSLAPDGFIQKGIEGLFRIRDLFAGNAGFDREFTVRGNPADIVKEFLGTQEIQAALMHEPGMSIGTYVDRDSAHTLTEKLSQRAPDNRRQIILHLHEEVLSEPRLTRLVSIAEKLYDRIREVCGS